MSDKKPFFLNFFHSIRNVFSLDKREKSINFDSSDPKVNLIRVLKFFTFQIDCNRFLSHFKKYSNLERKSFKSER